MRRTKVSPTARTLKQLRQEGYQAFIVEKWNPHARIRQDLGGFGDVLAWHGDKWGCLAVQVTTRSHQADRVKKILGIKAALDWVRSGNRLEVHGWAQVGPRGKRKYWEMCRIPIELRQFVR